MKKLLLMGSTAVALATMGAGAAQAQAAADAGTIGEVIVTANKRSENLQTVAASVTAIGADLLEQRGILNSRGLADMVPGLKVQGVNAPAVFVRGVGTSNSSSTGDQGVAIHFDGVFHARPTAFAAGFVDLERVEVLKGPQGTLYGRGALGGNINVISKAPTHEFEGSALLEGGTYSQIRANGVVNIPVTDKLAIRTAFQTERHDGYSSNGGDDTNTMTARFRARYDVNDKITADLIAFYSDNNAKGATQHFSREYSRYAPKSDKWDSEFPTQLYGIEFRDAEVSANINADLGFATLTYIPAYVEDRRSENSPTVVAAGASGPTFSPVASNSKVGAVMRSHEVRLASPTGQRLEWTVGGFMMLEKLNYAVVNRANWGFIRTDSKSVFADATFSIVGGLRAIGGIRATDEKKHQENIFGYVYTGSWSPVTGRVGLDYKINDDSMVYATISEGFKSGGFFTAPGYNLFDPEEVVTYEIGTKNRFFADRVQVNLSAYRYDYDGYTVNVTVPGYNGATAQGVFNAGKVKLQGADLETIFRITPRDRLEVSGTYVRARFLSFSVPTTSGKVGDQVPQAPVWSGNVAYEHTFDFDNGAMVVTRLESHLETRSWLTANHRPYISQPGFMKSAVTVTYTPPRARLRVSAWVRNIENVPVKTSAVDTVGLETYIVAAPRTAGVTLSANF